MSNNNKLPLSSRLFILVSGLLQGVAIYYFVEHRSVFLSPYWQIGYLLIFIAVPFFAMLLVETLRQRLFWIMSGAYLILMILLGGYTGYQCTADGVYVCKENLFPILILPQAVLWFIALFYAQVWLREGRTQFSYSALYDASWHNTITMVMAGVFTGLAWAILGLCAALFNAIDIPFFTKLFSSDAFIWPANGLLFAVGVVLFRNMIGVVEVIKRILRVLVQWLLVGVAVLVIGFLCSLLFTGLQPLWNTHSATMMLLWIIAITLFFLCAVYQDGQHDVPYPRVLGWIIKAAIIVLPIYALIAAYALTLRVNQYGWTTDRVLAALVLLLLSAFTFAYVFALLRYRQQWVIFFVKTNRRMAVVVAIMCALLATPVLDGYRISAHSQLARFTADRVKEYNYLDYLRFDLGRPGIQALQELRERDDVKQNVEVLAQIDAVIAKQHRWDSQPTHKDTTVAMLRKQIPVYPKGTSVSDAVFEALLKSEGHYHHCSYQNNQCYMLVMDMNGDAVPEYMVIRDGYSFLADIYAVDGKSYKWVARTNNIYFGHGQIKDFLEKGDFASVKNPWKQLRLGDKTISVTEEVK